MAALGRKPKKRFIQNNAVVVAGSPNILNLTRNGGIHVPSDFFGAHYGSTWYTGGVINGQTVPADRPALIDALGFTSWRSLDSGWTTWADIETTAGSYNFTNLIARLQNNKNNGRSNMVTIYGTPQFHIVGPKSCQWTANTAKTLTGSDYSKMGYPTPANKNGKMYICTTAGTTGATEPAWNTSGTTTDGSVVWTARDYHISPHGNYYANAASSASLTAYVTAMLTACNTSSKLIDYIEFWNEPNPYVEVDWTGFFHGRSEDWVRMCWVASQAVSGFSGYKPKFGAGGFTSFAPNFDDWDSVVRSFMSAYDTENSKYGYQIPLEFISYHLYGGRVKYLDDSNDIAFGYYHRRFKKVLEDFGKAHLPIYNSESGIVGPQASTGGVENNLADKFISLSPTDRKTIVLMVALSNICAGITKLFMYNCNDHINGFGTNNVTNWITDTDGLVSAAHTIKTWKFIEYAYMNRSANSITAKINGTEQTFIWPSAATALGIT